MLKPNFRIFQFFFFEEFYSAWLALNLELDEEVIKNTFDSIDVDCSGTIEYFEFESSMLEIIEVPFVLPTYIISLC